MKKKSLAQKLSFVTSHKFFNLLTLLLLAFNILSPLFFASSVNAASISASSLISLTNQARSNAGLTSLNYNGKLTSAACAKANDMFAKDYWSHYGPNGETPWQFIKAAGYYYIYAGENLGKGFSSDSSLFNAWMASASHKANIMKPEFRDIGICVKDGTLLGESTTLVVQMFGALPGSQTTTTNVQATTSSTKPTTIANTTSKATTKTTNLAAKTSTSIAPVIIKDTTAPDKPVITNPQNGTITNNEKFQVNGTAENNSKVQIFQDQSKLGESIAQNGIWTYDPTNAFLEGNINLLANATDSSGNISPNSDQVIVTLDKTSPIIDANSFQIINKTDCDNCSSYNASLKASDNFKLAEVKAMFDNIEYKDFNFTTGTLSIVIKLDSGSDLQITAKDLAGNSNSLTISNSDIKSKIVEYEKKNNLILPSSNFTNSELSFSNLANQIGLDLTDLVNRINSLNFQHKVNLFVIAGLLLLFLIDGSIVYSGGIRTNRSKSGNHFSKLFIILILIVFSGFGGSILIGV